MAASPRWVSTARRARRVVSVAAWIYFPVIRGLRRSHFASDPVSSFLPPLAPYPQTRLRRNRRDAWSRKLVAETVLTAGDLIWPVFVHDEDGQAAVPSMPAVFRLSPSALVDAAGGAAVPGCPTLAGAP